MVSIIDYCMWHHHSYCRHDDSKGRKDLAELTWEQREHVLRLLFSKMNSSGVI